MVGPTSDETSQRLARLVALFRLRQERGFSSLSHLGTPNSLSVRDATAPKKSCPHELFKNRIRTALSVFYLGYFKGISVCLEDQPTLGTETQNILTDGMYLVMLPVGAVRANTWNRQFSTSAT